MNMVTEKRIVYVPFGLHFINVEYAEFVVFLATVQMGDYRIAGMHITAARLHVVDHSLSPK